MGDHFTMWIKKQCPFCVKAREELFDQGVNHTVYFMGEKLDELEEIKEKWGHATVPIIVRSTTAKDGPAMLIGGYTELEEYFSGEEND